jgi:ribonuclease E
MIPAVDFSSIQAGLTPPAPRPEKVDSAESVGIFKKMMRTIVGFFRGSETPEAIPETPKELQPKNRPSKKRPESQSRVRGKDASRDGKPRQQRRSGRDGDFQNDKPRKGYKNAAGDESISAQNAGDKSSRPVVEEKIQVRGRKNRPDSQNPRGKNAPEGRPSRKKHHDAAAPAGEKAGSPETAAKKPVPEKPAKKPFVFEAPARVGCIGNVALTSVAATLPQDCDLPEAQPAEAMTSAPEPKVSGRHAGFSGIANMSCSEAAEPASCELPEAPEASGREGEEFAPEASHAGFSAIRNLSEVPMTEPAAEETPKAEQAEPQDSPVPQNEAPAEEEFSSEPAPAQAENVQTAGAATENSQEEQRS